jgi:hypothetical protein
VPISTYSRQFRGELFRRGVVRVSGRLERRVEGGGEAEGGARARGRPNLWHEEHEWHGGDEGPLWGTRPWSVKPLREAWNAREEGRKAK